MFGDNKIIHSVLNKLAKNGILRQYIPPYRHAIFGVHWIVGTRADFFSRELYAVSSLFSLLHQGALTAPWLHNKGGAFQLVPSWREV